MPAPEGRNPHEESQRLASSDFSQDIEGHIAKREKADRAEAPGLLTGDIDHLLREHWARGRRVGEQRGRREQLAEAFDAGWDAGAADGTEDAVAEAFAALDVLTAEVIEAQKKKPAAALKTLERISGLIGHVYVAMPKRAERPIEEPQS